MERMGPESLMLMAAAPIAYRPAMDDRALWEIPVTDEARPAELLAALPAQARREDPRGWLDRIRDWRVAARTPRGF